MPLPVHYLSFYRNIKGRIDLMVFLCRWDSGYRDDIAVIVAALAIFVVALFIPGMSGLAIKAAALGIFLLKLRGGDMSVVPEEYRPRHGGVKYLTETGASVSHGGKSFLMSGVFPPAPEEALGFVNPFAGAGLCRESPLASARIDDALMLRKTLPWREEPAKRLPVVSRHQVRYLAIRVANRLQHTTNGATVSLEGLAGELISDKPVTLRKSFYFDSLMTEEAFRSRILRNNLRGDKEVYADLTTNFPAAEEIIGGQDSLRLLPDFYARATGHIGITSLLVTENRRVALLYQGSTTAVGAHTVTFGGSGSLSYADLAAARTHDDLRALVAYGMAREMCEETGLQKYFGEVCANTMVTGFFRWVDRCGKPEFVGLTRAEDVPFSRERAIDGDEVVKFDEAPVLINTLADFGKVLAWVREQKLNIALSSLMALHRLTVIAAYAAPDAAPEQRRLYQQVSEFLFGSLAYLDKSVAKPYSLQAKG